jgi:hypothetical protein
MSIAASVSESVHFPRTERTAARRLRRPIPGCTRKTSTTDATTESSRCHCHGSVAGSVLARRTARGTRFDVSLRNIDRGMKGAYHIG